MKTGVDERQERIEILLDVMGDFNNLTNELSAQPACYSEIVSCVDEMIRTLRKGKVQLEKIKKEIANGSSHSDDSVDPA